MFIQLGKGEVPVSTDMALVLLPTFLMKVHMHLQSKGITHPFVADIALIGLLSAVMTSNMALELLSVL